MNMVKVMLAALAIATSLATVADSAGPPSGLDVNVTNRNVPVIVNNPASSPIPVTLGNAPSSPVVIRSAETPYSISKLRVGCVGNCTVSFPAVPEGKILLVKHVTAEGSQATDEPVVYGWLSGTPTVSGGEDTTTTSFPLTNARGVFVASVPVLAFISAGHTPTVTAVLVQDLRATISGYLVDAAQ